MWQLFLKNAGTACGKRDNCLFHNGFHVPEHPGTRLGQVGTKAGHGDIYGTCNSLNELSLRSQFTADANTALSPAAVNSGTRCWTVTRY